MQYLQNIAADAEAAAAESFFCIHGYAGDGVSAANATPTLWDWWANGWSTSPTLGIASNIHGFTYYGKKSWMTETSGEDPAWLSPATGYPNAGAWSIALRLHQALTTGRQSAWLYWQLTDGNAVGPSTLTSSTLSTNSAKYIAAKHYFRFIRPDAVRVEATVTGSTNLLASAYLHDTNRTLTVVLLNTSPEPISGTMYVPAQPAGIASFRVFSSSASNYWQCSSVSVNRGTATVTIPGYGVVTLYGAAPPFLKAAITSPGRLNLSWNQAALGFLLQSTPTLQPCAWVNETNTCVVTNGTADVSAPLSSAARFYRLILP